MRNTLNAVKAITYKADAVKLLFQSTPPRRERPGFRGVYKYYTRKSKQLRYKAWITVNGKKYYKGGFKTPEEAYYNGRLMLEEKYLPKKSENEKDN